MKLFYYTTTSSLDIFFVSLFQILTKPCLTSIVFLSGLLEICNIDEIQGSTCELQTDLIFKEDASTVKPHAHHRLPKPPLKILPIYGNFFTEKTFRKNVVSCPK